MRPAKGKKCLLAPLGERCVAAIAVDLQCGSAWKKKISWARAGAAAP